MRKIIAGFAASLDGYIEGPNGEYDWIIQDKETFDDLGNACVLSLKIAAASFTLPDCRNSYPVLFISLSPR